MNDYSYNDPSVMFLDVLGLIERLHRRLLDVIKNQMEEISSADLNPVQALLIHNIGEVEVTAGELKTRGYYQGSNVSYNLKKLVEMGYLCHERSEHDRRAVRISLTEKGHKIHQAISALYDQHLNEMMADGLVDTEALKGLKRHLRNIERYWTDRLRYSF